MIQELEEYLSKSRPLFILPPEEKTSDLLVDRSLPLQEQEKQVLNTLSLFEEKIEERNYLGAKNSELPLQERC